MLRWQHPESGQLITFQDRRAAALVDHANEVKAAQLPDRLEITRGEVAGHEARHIVCALMFGFNVSEASANIPNAKAYGHVVFGHQDEQWDRMRLAELAVTYLVGGFGDKEWPPSWPPDPNGAEADEEALAHLAGRLKLNEKAWNGLVDVARTIIKNRHFKQVTDSYRVLLGAGMTLNRQMIRDIYSMNRKQTHEEASRRESTAQVKQHRDWMIGVLEAGTEYAASQELRRRCEDLERSLGL